MDKELRLQLLRASVRDRAFLKESWRDITPDDFPEREEVIVAKAAIAFYEQYETPVGAMLRSEAEDLAREERLGPEGRKRLRALMDTVQGTQIELVSVKALSARLRNLKKSKFYDNALEEIVTAKEQNKLTVQVLKDLVERADKELTSKKYVSHDYFSGLEKRIYRRDKWDAEKYPYLMIEPLDSKIKAIGRGMLGVFLAPPSGGKGLALLHVALAYCVQGLNVLHISLEDPQDLVENRLDACITGIPLNRLRKLPNRLRKRYERMMQHIKGKLHIIDGTDGGWTVSDIEKLWEEEARNGFVADAIIIDYDDEIECEKQFKGESARRFEFAEIYKRLRRLARKTNTIVWTAAQTSKKAEGRKVVTSKDTAEDFSKIRKVFLAIGIGCDMEEPDVKYLYVMKHRLDRSRFGVEIVSNYDAAIFYMQEETARRRLRRAA